MNYGCYGGGYGFGCSGRRLLVRLRPRLHRPDGGPGLRTAGGESPRPRHWQSQGQGKGKDRQRDREHQGGFARRRQVVRRWQVDRHAGGVADVLDAHPVPGPDVRLHLPRRKSCATAARRVTPGGWSSARAQRLRFLPRPDGQRHHGDRPGEPTALTRNRSRQRRERAGNKPGRQEGDCRPARLPGFFSARLTARARRPIPGSGSRSSRTRSGSPETTARSTPPSTSGGCCTRCA